MLPKNRNQLKSWTLFIDRDGVINERIVGGYVSKPSEFKLLPGVKEALLFFRTYFGRVILVTNQQGIGKNIMTENDLGEVHKYMDKLVGTNVFDAKYFAPQLAKFNSIYRKPNPGMALRAKHDFGDIDFNKSIMVGDSKSDLEMGKSVGMKLVAVSPNPFESADLFVSDLMELLKYFN